MAVKNTRPTYFMETRGSYAPERCGPVGRGGKTLVILQTCVFISTSTGEHPDFLALAGMGNDVPRVVIFIK